MGDGEDGAPALRPPLDLLDALPHRGLVLVGIEEDLTAGRRQPEGSRLVEADAPAARHPVHEVPPLAADGLQHCAHPEPVLREARAHAGGHPRHLREPREEATRPARHVLGRHGDEEDPGAGIDGGEAIGLERELERHLEAGAGRLPREPARQGELREDRDGEGPAEGEDGVEGVGARAQLVHEEGDPPGPAVAPTHAGGAEARPRPGGKGSPRGVGRRGRPARTRV